MSLLRDIFKNVKNYCLGFGNIFGMGLQLGILPFWKLAIRTVFNYFTRVRFGRLPGKRQKLLFWFLKIFLVRACSWTCYHFLSFSHPQSRITFPRSSQVITVISSWLHCHIVLVGEVR